MDGKGQPTGQRPGRVRIENVNHPGTSTSVDAGPYNAMREALLAVLPRRALLNKGWCNADQQRKSNQ